MSVNFEFDEGGNGGGEMPPSVALGSAARGIGEIVEALCALLAREREALKEGRYEPLAAFAAEKHHLLAQFDRHAKVAASIGGDTQRDIGITRLREALDANMRLLKFRMDAINELADTIEHATRAAESDGTYDGGPGMGWA